MSLVEMTRGDSPVILSFPHTGTEVPRRIWERLNENGRILADTDWHVHRLYLFEGRLPDFNIGTDHGVTCDPAIEGAVVAVTRSAPGFDTVLNGRFRGGWTTRHYGRPKAGVHTIQMELAQSTYLSAESPPFDYDVQKATALRRTLKDILEGLARIAVELKR